MARSALLRAGLASLAFVALGLPDGLLGVAWPSIRAQFALPLDALGALLVSFTSGYVVSSFAGGRMLSRLGIGPLLVASCLITGLSLFGYAGAAFWWVIVALGSLAGIGAGGIDTGINTYAASHHGPRMLNWLHACYGIGAAGGPALMTALFAVGLPWQRGYITIGAAQLALAAAFLVTLAAWPAMESSSDAAAGPAAAATIGETLRLPAARLGILLFLVYTGLELAVGAWAFSLLTMGRGLSPMMGGTWTTMYWAGLTVGRLGGAAMASIVPVGALLRGSMLLLTAGLALLASGASLVTDFAGLALAGAAAGPIFPSLIATTPSRLGERHAANAVGFQIAAAAVGQSLLPTLLGGIGSRFDLEALAKGLVVLSVCVLFVYESLLRVTDATPAGRRKLATEG